MSLRKRDRGRTTFGCLWRLGLVVAIPSAGAYAFHSVTDIRRKIEPMISDGIQAKTGRLVRSVKLKYSWSDN
jgi:hypothetical protein